MKYKPYSPNWTRYRALQEVIYDYLQDEDTSPEVIGNDIKDILNEWVNQYTSRVEKGKNLINILK